MLPFHKSAANTVAKPRHHLSHHWAIVGGVPMLSAVPRPAIGGGSCTDPDMAPHQLPSLYPPNEGPLLPPWLAYDKQVLHFHGYFKETLQEVHRSPYQVRPVNIYFYLEDGTMQVTEVRRDNSGLMANGSVVSRQRIPRPAPCHGEFLSVLDLNVAQTVTIFSRVYQITDCDRFTRHFLNRAGVSVPDPIEVPADPGLQQRQNTGYPKRPSVLVDTLGQFLRNDRRVLRFTAYWDDRDSMFGDLRDLELFYYLADDTVHIRELYPHNAGRDGTSTFLARGRLPRCWTGMPAIGQHTPFTVLNVLGGGVLLGKRHVTDALNVGDRPEEYYTDRDLTIGGVVNVYGRAVHLVDCDAFTREYYRSTYGLEDFTPVPKPMAVAPSPPEIRLPVFNGWGTHESSESNCRHILLRSMPRGDFDSFVKHDGVRLRFGAKMLRSKNVDDASRVFIVTFHLATDELSVYELGVRNSGFVGGDFFKRAKFARPGAELMGAEPPQRYRAHHLYVGAELELRGFVFGLVTADEFGLGYMEAHPNEFVLSNLTVILAKVREALRPQYKAFVQPYLGELQSAQTESGQKITVASYETLRQLLIGLLQERITDHEIITVARHFASESRAAAVAPQCDRETVRSIVHSDLNRGLWDDLDRVREHLYHLQGGQAEHVRPPVLRSAVMACRLPLQPVLVDHMMAVLEKNEIGDIVVRDFLQFIDRIGCRSIPIAPRQLYKDVCPVMPFNHAGRVIDWNCFISKLGLEEALVQETE